jgi:hypothetical protein
VKILVGGDSESGAVDELIGGGVDNPAVGTDEGVRGGGGGNRNGGDWFPSLHPGGPASRATPAAAAVLEPGGLKGRFPFASAGPGLKGTVLVQCNI